VTAAVDAGGPVSAWLEADLSKDINARGIVIWLDADDRFSAFVDRLAAARTAGDLPYDVCAFRGSYLELLLSLERVTAGAELPRVLIHLPGLNQETVRRTPLLELYEAGKVYRPALETVVSSAAAGHVRPERIAEFAKRTDFTLEAADSWLLTALDTTDDGLAARLRSLSPAALIDDLLKPGTVGAALAGEDAEAHDAVWTRLAVSIGTPADWRAAALPPHPRAEDVAFAAASWALCVEYVDDLKRPPVNAYLQHVRDLPRAVIDACRETAAHLRERHASFYQRTADETELLLDDEVRIARVEDLGRVDTFRFEEDRVLQGALAALEAGDWNAAAAWAEPRIAGKQSFWLRGDVGRQSAWQLVGDAARLGQAMAAAGERLGLHGTLDEAVDAYVARGAAVDRAHRHLEQHRAALLLPQAPDFETLRARLDEMRRLWRRWADAWARDFSALCRTHGFLPDGARQQRTLFDEVVRPLTQEPGTTALFVVDALRFEMAEELLGQLEGTPATTLSMKARLAELPTVTDVGMNVLAPVAVNGRLQAVADGGSRLPASVSRKTETEPTRIGPIAGFSTGEYRVTTIETRQRAMHARVGGGSCPWLPLAEVIGRDSSYLRRAIAQAKLVVVHSREIDQAGEAGAGLPMFDQVLRDLRTAWTLLRDAGVRRFVITADHGFLLLDDTTASAQTHGRRVDPSRRHVFYPEPADHDGEVRVALSDLGYEGVGGHLMFPDTTAVFDTGRRSSSFVHGGNSLQERVIPVLTLVHRSPAGGSTLQYELTVEALEDVAGMHCLRATVQPRTPTLDFGAPGTVDLALRVVDAAEVQVELCQTRAGATLVAGGVRATVGASFELFFRLLGPGEARVLVELYHAGADADVARSGPEGRFTVTPIEPRATSDVHVTPTAGGASGWLVHLPEGGVRDVFAHLEAHGAITEDEAAAMLGGPRGARRFALQFESVAAKAPFLVRIDVVGGVKRYVREGSR
jgi:hypothetical protein